MRIKMKTLGVSPSSSTSPSLGLRVGLHHFIPRSPSIISILLIVILHISLPPRDSFVLAVPTLPLSSSSSSSGSSSSVSMSASAFSSSYPYSHSPSSQVSFSSLDKDNNYYFHQQHSQFPNTAISAHDTQNYNINNKNANVQEKFSDVHIPASGGGDNMDSGEDGQYYDDDASVTFIGDDDIYDDAGGGFVVPHTGHQHYGQYQHGSYRKHMAAMDEKCPPLPQEAALSDIKLCEVNKCQRDSDCSNSRLCCFNGCVHSCLIQVDAPLAFDWLEETELKFFHNGSDDSLLPTRGRALSPKMMMSEVTPETIALPGGCLLNPQQYEDLRLFRKQEHVHSCTCLQGDVVCHVNVDKDRLVSSSNTNSNSNSNTPAIIAGQRTSG